MKFFSTVNQEDLINFEQLFNDHKVIKVELDSVPNELLGDFYRKLASRVGIPLIYEEDPITGEIIQNKWTEIRFEPSKSKSTYKHSSLSQPLHTDYGYFSFDMPVSFFYCVTAAPFGGATTFIDADKIVDVLKAVDSELFELLLDTPISFGRNDAELTNRVDKILSKDEIGWKINWNYYRAQNDLKNLELSQRFKCFLDDYIEKSGELFEVYLKKGEGVFFHDSRVLHGRNSFIGDRHLNKGALVFELPDFLKK